MQCQRKMNPRIQCFNTGNRYNLHTHQVQQQNSWSHQSSRRSIRTVVFLQPSATTAIDTSYYKCRTKNRLLKTRRRQIHFKLQNMKKKKKGEISRYWSAKINCSKWGLATDTQPSSSDPPPIILNGGTLPVHYTKYLKTTKTNLLLINLPNHMTILGSHMTIRGRYIKYHTRKMTLNLLKHYQ